MISVFGWKAAIAVILNTMGTTLLFRRELSQLSTSDRSDGSNSVPLVLVLVHLAFLAGIVVFAHHPAIFVGLFLFFLGVADAYRHHQDCLILREGSTSCLLSDRVGWSSWAGNSNGGCSPF